MIKSLPTVNRTKNRYSLSCRAALGLFFVLFIVSQLQAQNRTVTGKVTAASDGVALPGANVVLKGTTNGTITNADGSYSLSLADGNDGTLLFSYVGFLTQEVPLNARSIVDIVLQEDAKALEEVVVVGYGVVRKTDLTGSVAVIDPKELTKVSTNDVTQMMQGRTPGVAINSSGQPGASPSVKIRGIGTFGNNGTNSEPLYVVDGLPLGGQVTTTGDAAQPNASINPIRDINPNDIESIQVLKDASAGAIYGVRAANGVVIITTKKGRLNQGIKIDASMYLGVQNVTNTIPMTHREDYQMINRETFVNGGQNSSPPIPPGNYPTSPDYITTIDTDWQKSGLKQGTIQNYNVGLSGGSASTSFFGSVDYFKNTGTLVGNGPSYSRYSVRLNADTKKGNFRFGEKLYGTMSDETSALRLSGTPGANPPFINDLIWAAPTIPIYDPNREGGYGGSSAIENSLSQNIIGLNSMVNNKRNVSRAIVSAYAEYDIIKNLTYRISGQYDFALQTDDLFVPMYDLGFFYPNGSAYYDKTKTTRTSGLIENTLSYKKTVNRHNLSAVGGMTFQNFYSDRMQGRATGLQKPYTPSLSNGNGTKSVSERVDQSSIFSFLGRVEYNYDDRYFVTANIRRDGSSVFNQSNRYVVMPSVALAWKIHKDIKMPEFIRELKLRGGIGQVGNAGIGSYGFTPVLNTNVKYAFNDQTVFGTAAYQVVDPNLKWELRTTRSIGIDAAIMKDIDFTFEYYSNKAEDILVGVPVTLTEGAFPASVFTNGGSMQNSGIEFSLNYHKSVGDFTFDVSPNFYTLKNEVLKLGQGNDYLQDQNERTEVGGSLGRHYGWVYEGLFQNSGEVTSHAFQSGGTGPGDIKFKDLKADNIINDADRTYLKSAIPNFYYGLNITMEYKGFDFTIFGSGSSGAYGANNMYRGIMSSQSSGNTNYHTDILRRWTPTNTNTDVPRMIYLDPNNNARPSDRPGWLQSTAYFRLNTLSLGYSIPQALKDKMHLTKGRIYITGQNIKTFTSYKGFNPDFQSINLLSPGFDFGTYPRPATWMAGIQLSF